MMLFLVTQRTNLKYIGQKEKFMLMTFATMFIKSNTI